MTWHWTLLPGSSVPTPVHKPSMKLVFSTLDSKSEGEKQKHACVNNRVAVSIWKQRYFY